MKRGANDLKVEHLAPRSFIPLLCILSLLIPYGSGAHWRIAKISLKQLGVVN